MTTTCYTSILTQRILYSPKDNLAVYDGVIAVSHLDKDIFVNEYGFPPERVVVIDNGVNPKYFAFIERKPVERPEIVYTGSFSYLPNQAIGCMAVDAWYYADSVEEIPGCPAMDCWSTAGTEIRSTK